MISKWIIDRYTHNQRKINVSHTNTWKEDEPNAEGAKPKAARPAAKKPGEDSSAVKAVNAQVEKSTLGDIDALAALKEKMEGKSDSAE